MTTLRLVPRRIPDHLIAIQDAAEEYGIGIATIYRWLRSPPDDESPPRPVLHRYRVPGNRRTFLDRRELEEALRPTAE